MKKYRSIHCIALILLLTVGSCRKADEAFEQLQSIPELELTNKFIYKGAYVVGDTMVLYGRLNPSKTDFRVKIGNTAAPLLGWRHLPQDSVTGGNSILYPYGLDEVKVKITASMGAGEKRPVWITSGGYNIEGPPVDIMLVSPDTASFDHALTLTPYYFLPDANARIFYCVNGKGAIYLYENGVVKVIRNRRSVTLFSEFTDQFGEFTITKMYSGGVDFHERYLYFSAMTGENSADAADNYIFRFCRYDLESGQLTALNRTLVTKARQEQTLQSLQPFEGQIGQVKMQAAEGIYPDSSGNIILVLQQIIRNGRPADIIRGHFSIQAMVKPDGSMRYGYNSSNYTLSVYNTEANGFMGIHSYPGVMIDGARRYRISPEDKLLYANYAIQSVSSGYRVYDLAINDMIQDFAPQIDNTWILEGPFSSLAFRDGVDYSSFYGHFAMPGKRMLLLSSHDGNSSPNGKGTMLNFGTQSASAYAPAIDAANYFRSSSHTVEPVINYDQQGHLYIYSATEREIVKTVKR